MPGSTDSLLRVGARIFADEDVAPRRLLWKKEPATFSLSVLVPLRRLESVWPGVRPDELILEFVIRDQRGHYRPAYHLQIGGDDVQRYAAEQVVVTLADPLGPEGARAIEAVCFHASGIPMSILGSAGRPHSAQGSAFEALLLRDDGSYLTATGVLGSEAFPWRRAAGEWWDQVRRTA